jgi:YidC/Oxa1 family membrane protein insertase
VEERQPQPIETKRLIIGMALAMAVVIGWQVFIPFLYRKMGWQMPGTGQPTAATQPAATAPAATQPLAVEAGPGPTTVPAGWAMRVEGAADPESQRVTLGSAAAKDPNYSLQLSLDPRGAGINSVVLNDFKRSAKDPALYTFQEPYAGHEALSRPLGTRWINLNGQTLDLSNVAWKFAPDQDPAAATYVVDLPPSLQLRKTFRVFPRNGEQRKGSGGYEVLVEYGFRNLTGADLKVKAAFNGPTLPPREVTSGPDRQVVGGYQERGNTIAVHAFHVEGFTAEEPNRDLLKDDDERPVVWAGAASVYFEALVVPDVAKAGAQPFQAVRAEGLGIREDTEPGRRAVATVFETAEITVPANAEATLPLNVYLGPKWRKVLKTDYYVPFPRMYHQTLVIASGMCAICTFDWLINLLVLLLNGFHWVFGGFAGKGDWGLAIIGLVVLVRTLLHPITKRSQVSMMKLGKMGPQIEALKKKYGDDKDAMSRAMWEFQKSQGITPILGCLPMFLQMPIWIALWSSLQTTFELRQAPFLWGFTWIDDLSKPDHLIAFSRPIPLLFGWTIDGINLLPVLLAVVFFVQQKLQPKPPAMTPEQAQQQKMMQWMTLLFPLFLYNGPSGLNLYIFTSTFIGIIESKIIRKHIKQQEELEKGDRVIVDAPPTRASKRRRDEDEGPLGGGRKGGPPKKPAPTGWLGRKLAELAEKAEQVKREAERKAR